MVDDPGLFGAIAAANALNDVFAMGDARSSLFPSPRSPRSSRSRSCGRSSTPPPRRFRSGRRPGRRAHHPRSGAEVRARGGRDRSPRCALAQEPARPGDAVFLTKPLGTGLVLAAAAKGCSGRRTGEATRRMTELNDRAAEALRGSSPGCHRRHGLRPLRARARGGRAERGPHRARRPRASGPSRRSGRGGTGRPDGWRPATGTSLPPPSS